MVKSLYSLDDKLIAIFEDIANKVEIQSNFCICHPDYQPFTIPAATILRFQKLPEQIQSKYLSLLLTNFLYGIYYNGSLRSLLAKNTDLTVYQNLENNHQQDVDLEFYEQLHASNHGIGYFNPAWQVVKQESEDSLIVSKNGLKLYITRQHHLHPVEQSATIGDFVSIRMPKNLVQNGFYVAVGNIGQERQDNANNHSATGRIYFNVNPQSAIALMSDLTEQLNQAEIPFTFKILYNPSAYERYDSGVLYFECIYYEQIRQILQTLYVNNQCYFQKEVPLFSKFLAPGVSLAEEPICKFTNQESFGMNRCRIVANGLIDAWQQNQNIPEKRMQLICQQFSQMGIDWQRPYLNPNSEDIYMPLDFTLS